MPKEKKYTFEEFSSLDPLLPERREFINGRIYLGESEEPYYPSSGETVDMSPAPNFRHQEITGNIFADIINYIRKNKGGCKAFTSPADVRITEDETVQPDIFVTCTPEKSDGQKYNGAPDWIIEVLSPSSSKRDLLDKLYLYRDSGVREYWIVDPMNDRVLVYFFEESHSVEMYTFDSAVTAHIYSSASEPLTIRIADYFG